MNILAKQYQSWCFHGSHTAMNKYNIAYFFLGIKIWSKTLAKHEVPVHAWAGVACCGSTDWADDFHKKYTRISKACRQRKTVPLIKI